MFVTKRTFFWKALAFLDLFVFKMDWNIIRNDSIIKGRMYDRPFEKAFWSKSCHSKSHSSFLCKPCKTVFNTEVNQDRKFQMRCPVDRWHHVGWRNRLLCNSQIAKNDQSIKINSKKGWAGVMGFPLAYMWIGELIKRHQV